MKLSATISINKNLTIAIEGATINTQGDLLLSVSRATKKELSSLAYFPVHNVAILIEDFDCSLVLERKGADSGSISHYEENSMFFQLENNDDARRVYCAVANA